MAIQALEQELSEYAVDREQVNDILGHCIHSQEDYYLAIKMLNELPPVKQEPKIGHWIKSRDCYGNYHFTCSECGNDIATQYEDNWEDKYCSECGCRNDRR